MRGPFLGSQQPFCQLWVVVRAEQQQLVEIASPLLMTSKTLLGKKEKRADNSQKTFSCDGFFFFFGLKLRNNGLLLRVLSKHELCVTVRAPTFASVKFFYRILPILAPLKHKRTRFTVALNSQVVRFRARKANRVLLCL
eukprot:Pompholyxophrys_sp_v1_NODE_260_length_951_cov_6.828125.p2 type:complete len:139 gc:universal NODE_260_length_951_cov_6.828125:430-14(-)